MAEIELKTAPADFRFPTTNQTRHCFTRYIEFHRCLAAKGDNSTECQKFAQYYRSLCPGEWVCLEEEKTKPNTDNSTVQAIYPAKKKMVDRWNEQRDNGTFPGPL